MDLILDIAKRAKNCQSVIANAKTDIKNKILKDISRNLVLKSGEIIEANKSDMERSKKMQISESMLDRLKLDESRIKKIASSIDSVVELTDPVGEVIFGYDLPNGLILKNIRVPFGVIGIVYEARPNVTVDASVLCIKAGNCVILRGSSHALATNKKITEIMRKSLSGNDLPEDIVQIVPTAEREDTEKLMQLRDYIDVLIPRGGKNLIDSVVQKSKIPVIETGIGNCHIYIDNILEDINDETIINIIINSKTQKPSVCNAAEKLLIHKDVALKLLPKVLKSLQSENVLIKGCSKTIEIFPEAKTAAEEDWYEEYLDLIMAVKVVESIEDAVRHINKYGSGHSDAIITSSYKNSGYFTKYVDSSAVYVNASTRFTDGGEFGMGAELGISTQKLHWRGPMGLRQVTTNKFIIYGNGQIRS
ncbi:MAG: glutamate-5-semialdehyde dehydrogenase [Actinobacteria bacterium]|nr:glutamate-5-semialdehyde dehydrogenase [Actinomycetota bacterium]MCL5069836.1 glutamate-5-semialdehyde dehydrogenase [Actinomycetota bacterium]